MGFFTGLFTPNQVQKPSDWLRAISIAQEEVRKYLPLSLGNMEDHRDWCDFLYRLLEAEDLLKKLIQNSIERNEEEPWYPIRLSHRHFGRLEQLLYTNWLKTGF